MCNTNKLQFSDHAWQRIKEREIPIEQVFHIIKHGNKFINRDNGDREDYNLHNIRVIISNDDWIITVINELEEDM